jgi:small ligand-binding sensory domain FIST
MKVGIGYANEADAFASGMKIAQEALENGKISDPDLVLAFCQGDLDHAKYLAGITSMVGEAVPVIGGSAIGVITNEAISYSGHPAGAVIFSSAHSTFNWAFADAIDKGEEAATATLAKQIVQTPNDKILFVFYDSVKQPATAVSPPTMNASPLIIKGLEAHLRTPAPMIGAGVIGRADFQPTQQFCGHHTGTQRVVATMIGGDFSVYHCIMHGCRPMDGVYHTITDMDGAILRALDDKPIVAVINELYGNEAWQQQMPLKRLAIGVNHGEKYGPFIEEAYVNRLIMGVLPDRSGIVIFEPDLQVGTQIQFMFRDAQNMNRSAQAKTAELLATIESDGKAPFFGLYIDCAGRSAALSDTLTEEAEEVQKMMNQSGTPLFGFYSGSEIAPVRGRSRGLDWTGVLTVFAC